MMVFQRMHLGIGKRNYKFYFQEVLLGLDHGHIGMYCTLTGINTTIICKLFL